MLLMRERVNQLEWMDLGQFGPSEYKKTLEELALINRLTGGYAPTLRATEELIGLRPLSERVNPIRILDVGFGYGDTLREIAKWAKKKNVNVECVGVDLNPEAKRLAEGATPDDLDIRYYTDDVFKFDQGKFDIIINSLFMHHLTDQQIRAFIEWMTNQAQLGWFINDLHRHPMAYYFF